MKFLSVLVILTYSTTSQADNCKDTVKLSPPKIMNDGLLFSKTDAERILFVLEHCYPKTQELVDKQDEKLSLQVVQIHTATSALEKSRNLNSKLVKTNQDLLDILKEQNSIIHSDILWLLLGIGVGGTIAVLAK